MATQKKAPAKAAPKKPVTKKPAAKKVVTIVAAPAPTHSADDIKAAQYAAFQATSEPVLKALKEILATNPEMPVNEYVALYMGGVRAGGTGHKPAGRMFVDWGKELGVKPIDPLTYLRK